MYLGYFFAEVTKSVTSYQLDTESYKLQFLSVFCFHDKNNEYFIDLSLNSEKIAHDFGQKVLFYTVHLTNWEIWIL